MKPTSRILTLLAIGVGLAFAITWVIGVLAAVTFSPGGARFIARSVFIANVLYIFVMGALPAMALALLFGLFAVRVVSVPQAALVCLCSLPWLVFIFFTLVVLPFPQEAGILERLKPLASWSSWPAILAVPLGLWLASKAQHPSSLPNAA